MKDTKNMTPTEYVKAKNLTCKMLEHEHRGTKDEQRWYDYLGNTMGVISKDEED